MTKRACVLTRNDYLWQKIRLLLSDGWIAERINSATEANGADYVIIDLSDELAKDVNSERKNGITKAPVEATDSPLSKDHYTGEIITLGNGGTLPLPFENSALIGLLTAGSVRKSALSLGEKCVYLRGEKIPLTEVELSLFKVLLNANGSFVEREQLIKEVWGENVDGGVLNVYIHYLRTKLEKGEKIIISSRKCGYKIDEKYLNGTKGGV